MDFEACRWPENLGLCEITSYFVALNESSLHIRNQTVISFSHFLPRIDIMPNFIPQEKRILYPALGTIIGKANPAAAFFHSCLRTYPREPTGNQGWHKLYK